VKGRRLEDLLAGLPEEVQERALRYKRESDGIDFVVGRLLLREALEANGVEEGIKDIQYNAKGKPFLGSVFFNISHTEDLVVCAISKDVEMGIDVEKRKRVDLKNFKDWFSEKEWNDILTCGDSMKQFYWYWTRKESIIKAMGLDLSYLNQLEIDMDEDVVEVLGKEWILDQLAFDEGYEAAICMENRAWVKYYFYRR